MRRILFIGLIFVFLVACSVPTEGDKQYNFYIDFPLNVTLTETFHTLDEVIYNYDNIFLATLDDVEVIDGEQYKITVEKQYKGRADLQGHSLNLKSVVRLNDIGAQYLLFLRESNTTYSPYPQYSTGIYPSKVVDGKFPEGTFAGLSLKDIVKQINVSPKLNEYKYSVYEVNKTTENMKELIELSTQVLHIRVDGIDHTSTYTNSVNASVIAQYKRVDPEIQQTNIVIPSYQLDHAVKVLDEYLLFLALIPTVDGEELLPTTRYGSVFSKQDSSKWNEAISLLSQ